MKDESGQHSWEDAIAALRGAAGELREAVSRAGTPGIAESTAQSQLKHDVSRLEQSASELLGKLTGDMEEKRAGIEATFDRERASRSADQLKASLEELSALASQLTIEMANAASGSLRQAEPELKTAVGALDDVLASAATWVRATLDPERDHQGSQPSSSQPPLDDL